MINIIPTTFLLCFCFKILHLSDIQLVHLDLALITLFVIVTFLNQYYLCVFYSLNNKFDCFILMAVFYCQNL